MLVPTTLPPSILRSLPTALNRAVTCATPASITTIAVFPTEAPNAEPATDESIIDVASAERARQLAWFQLQHQLRLLLRQMLVAIDPPGVGKDLFCLLLVTTGPGKAFVVEISPWKLSRSFRVSSSSKQETRLGTQSCVVLRSTWNLQTCSPST